MTDDENIRLKHVVVKGFKSIKSLDLTMEPINILIGANGSGKSNFISLFTFLRNFYEDKLHNYVKKNGYANAFFYFGVKTTPEIEIDIDIGIKRFNLEFEHDVDKDSLVLKDNIYLGVEIIKETISNNLYTLNEIINIFYGIINKPIDFDFDKMEKVEKIKRMLEPLKKELHEFHKDHELRDFSLQKYLMECRVYHFHDTGPTAGFKQAIDLEASDYLYSDANNIAAFLYRLKTTKDRNFTKSYNDIVAAIKTVAPYFHNFYLEPRGSEGKKMILLKWQHRDHDNPFSANQLSDGTARFICMATLLLQPQSLRPASIVLDEPELGLHPAALEVLAELIKSASKENQVICSTQSVTFANQFEAKDFIVVDQEQGASVFKRVDKAELKDWLEDYAMGDIWTKNLIGGRPEW